MVSREAQRVSVLARTPTGSYPHRLVPDIVGQLRRHGIDAWSEDPDRSPQVLGRGTASADLYLLKSGTETALSLAGALAARGARIINPYPVAAACRDKIVQTQVLTSAGLPVPQSWLATDPTRLVAQLADGPLIVKDPRGSRGHGLHVVHSPDELRGLGSGPWLVMRYHQPEGPDLKLYRIGDEVFCVERPFPARTYGEKCGRLLTVSAEVEEIVRQCGVAFGIEIYGVDVIRHGGALWVVDMSAFPGFKGVPEAGRRIADHVADQVLGGAPQPERSSLLEGAVS